ncbi:MAG: hypothetical protein RLZZ562_2073, partial [Planctomycetota bacterium]
VHTSKQEASAKPGELPAPIQWKTALREKLSSLQASDGSFVNDKNPRWMESMNVLCTSYAMIALERCR